MSGHVQTHGAPLEQPKLCYAEWCRELNLAGTYDELDLGSMMCPEVLSRRLSLVVDASKGFDGAHWNPVRQYSVVRGASDNVPIEPRCQSSNGARAATPARSVTDGDGNVSVLVKIRRPPKTLGKGARHRRWSRLPRLQKDGSGDGGSFLAMQAGGEVEFNTETQAVGQRTCVRDNPVLGTPVQATRGTEVAAGVPGRDVHDVAHLNLESP